MSPEEDQPPVDPAETLRLIRAQQAAAARRLTPDPRLVYWPWGVAWLVGFALFFLRFGPNGRIFVRLPEWLPLTALFVLLAGAGIVFGVATGAAYRQITGDSSRRGGWYGTAWFLAYLSMGVTLGRITDSLPPEQARLVWAATAVGLTGVLHICGGAIFLDRNLYLLGVWVTVVNIVGVLAGPGWQALIVSVAGGGGMLIVGALVRARTARRRS